MYRCLQLAQNGQHTAMPNPCVGAVIVYNNKIIGEGYTAAFGGSHAEVQAIQSVSEENRSLLSKSTLYVTLEPCSHFGKTPPCSDLIIDHQIPEVVIGTLDPNPLVAGQGLKRLSNVGVKIVSGILESECKSSLRRFLKPIVHNRPYITLKWAECRNHNIALKDGQPIKISSPSTQVLTHKLRAEHQAILCGWKTIECDEPSLNNRLWIGNSPQVVVIDFNQKLNQNKYFISKSNWWRLVTGSSNRINDIVLDSNNLKDVLSVLYHKGLKSIFVEGGSYTHQQFIDQSLWDECFVFHGATFIRDGISAPQLKNAYFKHSFYIESDCIEVYTAEVNS